MSPDLSNKSGRGWLVRQRWNTKRQLIQHLTVMARNDLTMTKTKTNRKRHRKRFQQSWATNIQLICDLTFLDMNHKKGSWAENEVGRSVHGSLYIFANGFSAIIYIVTFSSNFNCCWFVAWVTWIGWVAVRYIDYVVVIWSKCGIGLSENLK